MLKLVQSLYLLKSVWAILAALALGSVLIIITGTNPLTAYSALFQGAFMEYHGLANTVVKMCPLLLAALAFIVPLRAGLFNIGAEGQIYIGALFSTFAALFLPEMPGFVHIIICCLAGVAGGLLWALIPALLKVYGRADELIITLLLNYVAINLVSYFVSGPMMEKDAPFPYSPEIPESLFLPYILPGTDAHLGTVFALSMAVILYFVFERTTLGLSMLTMGRNPRACAYAGLSLKKLTLLSFCIGGGLAGLAGTLEVLGLKYRLYHMFSPGYGFDGIVVAFLAGCKPLVTIISAMFLAGLRSGANIMQRAVGVDSTVIEAIKGLVIIFVALSLAFKFNRVYWAERFQANRDLTNELTSEMTRKRIKNPAGAEIRDGGGQ